MDHFVPVDLQSTGRLTAGLRPARIEYPQIIDSGITNPRGQTGSNPRGQTDFQQHVGLNPFSAYFRSSNNFFHLSSFSPLFIEIYRS